MMYKAKVLKWKRTLKLAPLIDITWFYWQFALMIRNLMIQEIRQ